MRKIVIRFILGIIFVSTIITCTNNTRAVQEPEATVKNESVKDTVETKKIYKDDPVVGMYECKKTNDKYLFLEDGTGSIFTGGSNTGFKWEHKGEMVILTYESFGKEYLLFDAKKNTLKENSELYGVLVFNKI